MSSLKFYNIISGAQEESSVDHVFCKGFEYYFHGAPYTRSYKCAVNL